MWCFCWRCRAWKATRCTSQIRNILPTALVNTTYFFGSISSWQPWAKHQECQVNPKHQIKGIEFQEDEESRDMLWAVIIASTSILNERGAFLTSFQYIQIAYRKSFQGELKLVGYFWFDISLQPKKGEMFESNLEMEGINQPQQLKSILHSRRSNSHLSFLPRNLFLLSAGMAKEIEEKRNPYRLIQEVTKYKLIPTFYIFRFQLCGSLHNKVNKITRNKSTKQHDLADIFLRAIGNCLWFALACHFRSQWRSSPWTRNGLRQVLSSKTRLMKVIGDSKVSYHKIAKQLLGGNVRLWWAS